MLATALTVAAIAAAPAGGDLAGPRVGSLTVAGENVTLWGAAGQGRKVLAAGNADVLAATAIGCPPDDADLWLVDSALPGVVQDATEQLRPDVTVLFRLGPRHEVVGGADARRYAAWTGLRYREGTSATTVEVTLAGRAGPRRASRLAYGIDRVANTRFAVGAQQDRRRLIAHGIDPRRIGKTG
jgi:hypothetical protein